jgi:hypothetical protein
MISRKTMALNRRPFQSLSLFDFWNAYVVHLLTGTYRRLVQMSSQFYLCSGTRTGTAWFLWLRTYGKSSMMARKVPCTSDWHMQIFIPGIARVQRLSIRVETSEWVQRKTHSAVCDELATLWLGTAVVWVVASAPHRQWRAMCMTECLSWVCSQRTSSRYPERKHHLWSKFLNWLLQKHMACSVTICTCTRTVHSGVE